MRPDTSKGNDALGSWPGSTPAVAPLASVSKGVALTKRASRPGFGRVGPTREPAARREVAALGRNDATPRPGLRAGADLSEDGRHEGAVARSCRLAEEAAGIGDFD